MMTRFKICGIQDVKHAVVAAHAGAEFLGFVFVPGVRRQLSGEIAQNIIKKYRDLIGPEGPRLVGLFANQRVEDVNDIVRRCDLNLVQLCGDEPPEYWNEVQVPIIRQIKVRDNIPQCDAESEVLVQIREVVKHCHIPLLDKYQSGALGGTGLKFKWDIAKVISKRYDFILAGGLTPINVRQAITQVRPWAVDVSSGVERNGMKDSKQIIAFAEAVKQST